jgi:flagellar basal body-associated protein FliL
VANLKTVFLMVGIFLFAAVVGLGAFKYANSGKNADYEIETIRIDDMVTNIANGSMLKISLSVVVIGQTNSNNSVDELLRDAVVSYLRTVEKSDLEGVAGLDYLKSHLLSSARHALGANNVKEIYIREFIVQ